MTRRPNFVGLFLLSLSLSAVPIASASNVLFHVTDLGPGYGYAINNKGQAIVDRGIWDPVAGFRAHPLPAAFAINDAGQVVGYGPRYYSYATDTFTTMSGPGVQFIHAYGINAGGEAALLLDLSDGTQHAGRYAAGTVIDLGVHGGARDINDRGTLVGQTIAAVDGYFRLRAFAYTDRPIDIGTNGHLDATATAVNNRGQVVVVGYDAHNLWRSYVWENGRFTLAVPLTGSWVHDINEAGTMVGYLQIGGGIGDTHGYIYSDGQWRELSRMIDPSLGLTIVSGEGINDKGQVIGTATDRTGNLRAVLLTPVVPVPPAAFAGGAVLAAIVLARVRSARVSSR